MQSFELKLPPPVIAVLIAVTMWGTSFVDPLLEAPAWFRVSAAILLSLIGVAFNLSGVITFHRARTTINPRKPETASALVSVGIYRVTRNPMYVGLLCLLVAWATFLSSPWAWLGPPAFFFYVNRFQIMPEEKALSRLFGAEYDAYKAVTRRWL